MVRAMDAGDVDRLHALSSAVGWPHRREDWQITLELGEGIVAVRKDGTVHGCAMWWPFGEGLATIGMVIVAPALQGRGIGRRLLLDLLARTGSRTVRLVSTEAGRELYLSEGFEASGTLTQYQGTHLAQDRVRDPRVRPAVPGDRKALLALDWAASGGDRSTMLALLANTSSIKVLVAGERVEGYAFSRPFGRGRIVGPVVALDVDRGRALVAAHLDDLGTGFVRVDVLDPDRTWSEFLSRRGLAAVDRVVTMTRGPQVAGQGAVRIALASQALG